MLELATLRYIFVSLSPELTPQLIMKVVHRQNWVRWKLEGHKSQRTDIFQCRYSIFADLKKDYLATTVLMAISSLLFLLLSLPISLVGGPTRSYWVEENHLVFEWSYAAADAAALTPFMERTPALPPCHTIPLAKSENVKKNISWPLSMPRIMDT